MIAIIKKTTGQILLIASGRLSDKAAQRCLGISIIEVEQLDCIGQTPQTGKFKHQYTIVGGTWKEKSEPELKALGYDKNGMPLPSPEDLAAKAEQEALLEKHPFLPALAQQLKKELNEVTDAEIEDFQCQQLRQQIYAETDQREIDIYRVILQDPLITTGQVERYRKKYEMAKHGMWPDAAEANVIIQLYEAAEKQAAFYVLALENIRRVLFKLLDSRGYDVAKAAYDEARGLGMSITEETLTAFIAAHGGL